MTSEEQNKTLRIALDLVDSIDENFLKSLPSIREEVGISFVEITDLACLILVGAATYRPVSIDFVRGMLFLAHLRKIREVVMLEKMCE